MALPSREELKSMVYRDLRKVCKDWGVRANLKSEELIELLLRTQSKMPPAPPLPKQRSMSTRRSSKEVPRQNSPVTIQDVPDEIPKLRNGNPSRKTVDPPMPPQTRTRKAKEMQKRLGVGRPVAVGGSGPRAVTRSATGSHDKRSKGSQSMKQLEPTIQEEFGGSLHDQPASTSAPQLVVGKSQDEVNQSKEPLIATIPDYQTLFASIVTPLQDQIETLRAEVRRLQSFETEFLAFRKTVHQLLMPRAANSVGRNEEELDVQDQPLQENPSTPPPVNSNIPSLPKTLLGKRMRDASTSQSLIHEGEFASEFLRTTSGPAKKRPKLSGEFLKDKGKEVARDESVGSFDTGGSSATAMLRHPSFVVYNDDDDAAPPSPPPNNLLPSYNVSRSGNPPDSPRQGHSTSSANAMENQNQFNFSFLPAPLTPNPSLFIPPLPYPEPPQSPTPTGSNLSNSHGHISERRDVFKSFGMPPPNRAVRSMVPPSDGTINPAALNMQNSNNSQPSNDEGDTGFGNVTSAESEPTAGSSKEILATKKTMYGTELEGDTRFGDFGVGGVATGYWGNGRF